jgi:sigma-54 specific flagellar transcriptional regulator A
LEMQVKLLRVLQERFVDPVGSLNPVKIDVRVIAATHHDLEKEVEAGHFREDLYYRLNVIPLLSPPLRERSEDIPELLDFHAKRFAPAGIAAIMFDQETITALCDYEWPGNVRELSNLIDRFTTLFSGGIVCIRDIPSSMLPKGLQSVQEKILLTPRPILSPVVNLMTPPVPTNDHTFLNRIDNGIYNDSIFADISNSDTALSDVEDVIAMAQGIPCPILPAEGLSLKEHLADMEKSLLTQALNRTGGNVSQTARMLHLQRTTLIEKLNKYSVRVA